jgi:hypothetical protein
LRRLRHNPRAARAGHALLEATKVAATLLLAVALGIGVGKAIAALTKDPAVPQPPAAAAPSASEPAPVRVKVTFAGLRPVAAADGQVESATLRIGVRLRNRSSRHVDVGTPRIQVGERVVKARVDPDSLAGRTSRGLGSGARDQGELRFVTGATTTRQLTRLRRTTLLIGGRKIVVRFDVAQAQTPDGSSSTTTTTTATATTTTAVSP